MTALNPYIGYANATSVAQEAHATGGSVSAIVLQRGLLSREQLADILRPEVLTQPRPLVALQLVGEMSADPSDRIA